MYVYPASLCLCAVKWAVFAGKTDAEVETGADQDSLWGPVWGAVGQLGIGYSQNYFHMVQRPLVMSCTFMAWLPPPQHHPFNPRLSGETMETSRSQDQVR